MPTCAAQDFCGAHCRTVPVSLDALFCFDGLSSKPKFGVILRAWGGNEAP
jgi:hypothetical protein